MRANRLYDHQIHFIIIVFNGKNRIPNKNLFKQRFNLIETNLCNNEMNRKRNNLKSKNEFEHVDNRNAHR